MTAAELVEFAAKHLDLIELAAEAIGVGASKESIKDKIRHEMTIASDATMRAEFPDG